jgi:hypothetical protein
MKVSSVARDGGGDEGQGTGAWELLGPGPEGMPLVGQVGDFRFCPSDWLLLWGCSLLCGCGQ